MFVVVGQRVRTEPVDDGRSKVIECRRCGRPMHHYEHRVVRTATLFLVPVANVTEERVWCCEGCGTRLADGGARWLQGEQSGTAVGQVMSAVGALAEGARPALERLAEEARPALEQVQREAGPALERVRTTLEGVVRDVTGESDRRTAEPTPVPPEPEPEPEPESVRKTTRKRRL